MMEHKKKNRKSLAKFLGVLKGDKEYDDALGKVRKGRKAWSRRCAKAYSNGLQ